MKEAVLTPWAERELTAPVEKAKKVLISRIDMEQQQQLLLMERVALVIRTESIWVTQGGMVYASAR